MPRSRNIKPGFFANDDLADIEMAGRLLFIGLWTLADREGRLEDRPKKIRVMIFPYDPDVDVDSLLQQLHDKGFICRYSVGEERYIQVVNFLKHQRPHPREVPSTIPGMDEPRKGTTQTEKGSNKATPRHDQSNAKVLPKVDERPREEKGPKAAQTIDNTGRTTKATPRYDPGNTKALPSPSDILTTTTTTTKEWAEVSRLFSDNIHPISGQIEGDMLYDLFTEFGHTWMIEAIKTAVTSAKSPPSVKYLQAILERWRRDGFKADRKKPQTQEQDHAIGSVDEWEAEQKRIEDAKAARAQYIEKMRRANNEKERPA